MPPVPDREAPLAKPHLQPGRRVGVGHMAFHFLCMIPYVPPVYSETYGIVESISEDSQPCSSGKARRNQKARAAQRPKPPTVGRSSLQDQQFEEYPRLAERIVQALREAGYSCELDDDYHARALSAEN
jgi:hypothetical protein